MGLKSNISRCLKIDVIPDFKVKFEPDFRQDIAASWTESIDDSHAREDWSWNHEYDLEKMVADMLKNVNV